MAWVAKEWLTPLSFIGYLPEIDGVFLELAVEYDMAYYQYRQRGDFIRAGFLDIGFGLQTTEPLFERRQFRIGFLGCFKKVGFFSPRNYL